MAGRMADRYPQSYDEADRMLPTGRNHFARTLDGRDTQLVRISEHEIAIRYHWTDVIVFQGNGAIRLSSGGWLSSTTKDRMNSALFGSRMTVYQRDFSWYVAPFGGDPGVPFRDHMAIWLTGKITYHADSAYCAYVTPPDSQETPINA